MSMTKNSDFVLIRKPIAGVKNMKDAVTVGLSTDMKGHREGYTAYNRINIRLAGDVMDELGWSIGEHVAVHEGTGPSTGKLLLTLTDAGAHIGYKIGAAAQRYKDGKLLSNDPNKREDGSTMPGFVGVGTGALQYHSHPKHSVSSCAVKYRVFNRELLIDMPNWFKGIVRQAISQEQSNAPVQEDGSVSMYPKDMPRKRPYARSAKAQASQRKGKPA
jgi:hypothetical protein